MSSLLEDMLCGLLGYGIGKRNREFTQKEVESLIRSFLSSVLLEDLIEYWAEANGYTPDSPVMARKLRDKANDMEG